MEYLEDRETKQPIALWGAAALSLYLVWKAIYAVYFHPLRHIPGPKLNALSMIPYARHMLAGTTAENSLQLHEKYGEVVRVSPTEVSFISGETAFPDIYGFRTGKLKGRPNMGKDPAWYVKPSNGVASILQANDDDHNRGRRVLAHAFSNTAVVAQEPLVQRYVDQLVDRLKEVATANEGAADMVQWYTWTTFDIVADLTFGEPFGCLQNRTSHEVIHLLEESSKALRLLYILAHFPWLKYLGKLIIDNDAIRKRKEWLVWVAAQVKRRIERETTRPDFMALILANNRDKGAKLSQEEIDSNAFFLMNAGSETTATALSGVTWHLLRNPDVLRKLQDEIRGKFATYDDITLAAVNDTPYLIAVLSEGLRTFPPAAAGFGRVSPKDGESISGYYIPEGTVVSVSHYAAYRSERNFKDPDAFIPERWSVFLCVYLPSLFSVRELRRVRDIDKLLVRMDDPNFADDKRNAYQPFNFGPRSCLGKNLAHAEMRLILAKLVWSFDMELEERSWDWIDRCRVMRFWVKPDLAVRLREVKRG
ncbi:hypothetical protein BBP40_002772 [Aspergillus hancockii]|nr:hypothetical protein BBP40_002772 [Aspergillus hancockii]